MEAQDVKETSKEDSKSLSEWPTLGEVHMNEKQASGSANAVHVRNSKEQSPNDNGVDDDSAKENQESSKSNIGSKQKWVPLDVETLKGDKRKLTRNGKAFANKDDFNGERRKFDDSKKSENNKSRNSNPRQRGKKGRGYNGDWNRKRRGYSQDEVYFPEMNGYMPQDIAYYSYCPYFWNGYSIPEDALKDSLKKQIEYYFSEENLQKDFFMRRRMNAEGYIPIALIASFHRVQSQTQDINKVLEAVSTSDMLELGECPEKGPVVRTVVKPEQWPIHDALSTEFHDVPVVVPGKKFSIPGDSSDSAECNSKPNEPQLKTGVLPKNGSRKESRMTKAGYELSDQDVNKLIIVTQTPGNRKNDKINKSSYPSYIMSQEMATAINDGLRYYEQDLIGRYHGDLGYQGAGLYYGSMGLASPGIPMPMSEHQMQGKWTFPPNAINERFYPVMRNNSFSADTQVCYEN
ncbi:la-related protein 1 [Caerostris extrusa]|uniref:La-related protein 1 n=1 Tax=Caerostris extrusa TaxID=172846 RepID=A0AAV4VW52_CAEEX|nr:la-related protein 1 [Caerostris extrusa]